MTNEEREDRILEEQKLDEWDAGVHPDEEKQFQIEALYNALSAALDEAAEYVKADGHRKNAEIDDPTGAMDFHRRKFMEKMAEFNSIAEKLFVRRTRDLDTFFHYFVANTGHYGYVITRGKNKGNVEERTISSARIAGYRKTIAANKACHNPLSAQAIENEFRKTDIYNTYLKDL